MTSKQFFPLELPISRSYSLPPWSTVVALLNASQIDNLLQDNLRLLIEALHTEDRRDLQFAIATLIECNSEGEALIQSLALISEKYHLGQLLLAVLKDAYMNLQNNRDRIELVLAVLAADWRNSREGGLDMCLQVDANGYCLTGWIDDWFNDAHLVIQTNKRLFRQLIGPARLERADVATGLMSGNQHSYGFAINIQLSGEQLEGAWIGTKFLMGVPKDLRPLPFIEARKTFARLLPAFNRNKLQLRNLIEKTIGPAIYALGRGGSLYEGLENPDRLVDCNFVFGQIECERLQIIVPLYKCWHFLRIQLKLIEALAKHRPKEIRLTYVVDDPSIVDELMGWIGNNHEIFEVAMDVLILNSNQGFAMANFLGCRLSKSKYVLLMNSDVLPCADDWAGLLMESLDNDTSLGAIAPTLLFPNASLQHGGMKPIQVLHDYGFISNIHPGKGLRPDQPCSPQYLVESLTGACLILRREVLDEVGGFNPLFGQGDFEDLEFSLRLKNAGYQLALRSDICFTHLERQSYVQDVNPETQWQTWINSWLAEVLI